MNIAFSGGRDYEPEPYDIAVAATKFVHHFNDMVVLVGDCKTGVDRVVRKHFKGWGKEPMRIYMADWSANRKAAGPIRNMDMVDDADALIAFWDGKSPGTKNCIKCATDKGIPVLIMPIDRT